MEAATAHLRAAVPPAVVTAEAVVAASAAPVLLAEAAVVVALEVAALADDAKQWHKWSGAGCAACPPY